MKTMVLAVLATAALATAAPAQERPRSRPAAARAAATPPDTVALVGTTPITTKDLEARAEGRLYQVRTQEYELKRQVLDEAIGEMLLEREAKARGTTVAALEASEITEKVTPPTEAEIKDFFDKNRARIGAMPEDEAKRRIAEYLRGQKLQQRRDEVVGALREKAGVKVLLEPPRLAVAAEGPSRGPATAPVTIVEFSDFQCPFCSRAAETLKQVEQKYGDKVRLVFRDLPILQLHKDAGRAAEAAECAHEQGRFWAMHDDLFAHQNALGADDIKKRAAGLGLDVAAFSACLDSGRHTANWQKDAADAERYGVSSTPAFFVNGRLLVGAQPLEAFVRVIDEELQRGGPAQPPGAR